MGTLLSSSRIRKSRMKKFLILFFVLALSLPAQASDEDQVRAILSHLRGCNMPSDPYFEYNAIIEKAPEPFGWTLQVRYSASGIRVQQFVVLKAVDKFRALSFLERDAGASTKVSCAETCYAEKRGGNGSNASQGYVPLCFSEEDAAKAADLLNSFVSSMR